MYLKQNIRDTINDLVSDFLYYDRKEDEDLPVGAIDKAISDGIISIDEIVTEFKNQIVKNVRINQ